MISDRTINNLELNKLLAIVSGYSSSTMAKEKLLAFRPITDIEELSKQLDKTGEAIKYASIYGVNPSFSFVDVENLLISSKKGAVLSPQELL